MITLNQPVQRLVDLVLQTETAAHLLGIELRTGQVVHHLPIPIPGPDVLETFLADISNMEFFILFIKEHPARGHQAGS